MATSSKKVIVTGDDINPTLDKAFSAVVGGSLESEFATWLEGVDLMARGIVTVRGMKATLEHTFAEVGALPTITTSSVQYWGKAHALYSLEGGKGKTLKELLRLAREVSAVANGKNGAPTFAKAIEGKNLAEVRKATPTQGERKRKPSTASNKGKGKDENINTLIKALNKALLEGRGGKVRLSDLEELANTINGFMFEVDEQLIA